MGNCYSIDHIAGDHIPTDITCNIEEPQQKYRLGTVSNRLLRMFSMSYAPYYTVGQFMCAKVNIVQSV